MLSSQEIVTLGTGVGDTYDADVDGSHIRTLLLTFFYRHFPDVIERGHLYITQPPLYKVKAGKKEVYLKNDSALDRYVIDNAIDNLELAVGDHDVSRDVLAELASRGLRYKGLLDAMSREHRPQVLESVLDVLEADGADGTGEAFADLDRLRGVAQRLVELATGRLERVFMDFTLEADVDDPALHAIRLRIEQDGVSTFETITKELSDSPELEELLAARLYVNSLGSGMLVLRRGDETLAQSRSLVDLVQHMGEVGRKGLNIQRYKGLGEMNADQLWETTMDPDQRSLLQVRVGDNFEADNIFTVLMGDDVEPRREFITSNALNARNLDV